MLVIGDDDDLAQGQGTEVAAIEKIQQAMIHL